MESKQAAFKKFYAAELEEARDRTDKLREKFPELEDIIDVLLSIGGDVVEFSGWASPTELLDFSRTGRSTPPSEVSLEMAYYEECEVGLCWANAAEIESESDGEFVPAYAFALAERSLEFPDASYKYWIEHFLLKHVKTGTYHESVDTEAIIWYYIVDIDRMKFYAMGSRDISYTYD